MSIKQLQAQPVSLIKGELIPPGDKSISHRAVMIGALADGESVFSHFLNSEDCLNTILAFEKMGIEFRRDAGKLFIKGSGINGLRPPQKVLDCGNSGTTMRLMLGLLAGQSFDSCLTGDASLVKRPMRRVTGPLKKMGAHIQGSDDANFAPLTVKGSPLKGINWFNDIGSAQVKSAILFAGLYASGDTIVEEQISSRDHTERMLTRFGAPIKKHDHMIEVSRAEKLKPIAFHIPGDISSAAFFIVAAAMLPGSEIVVRDVGLNKTRTGFIEILKAMGAQIEVNLTFDQGEPIGDIVVRGGKLRGVQIGPEWIPSLIDELPILMIAASVAEGTTVIKGAHELRVKETDRIQSMTDGIHSIGGRAKPTEDGCMIEGVDRLKGGMVQSQGDHRTAMSFAIAGLTSENGILVQDTECINTSYPGFESDLKGLIGP